MTEFDAVVVGGGHNGLVAAAYLAREGWGVCVLERNAEVGGCVATEELTLPGYRHDVMSSWHPLFHLSRAYADFGGELARHGLEYLNTDAWTTASVGADGSTVRGHRDPVRSAAELSPRDGAAYLAEIEGFEAQADLVGALMGEELHSARALRLIAGLGRRLGRRGGLRFGADMLASSRAWLESRFEGSEPAHLHAPWVLHTGLDPDAAGGGFLTLAIAASPHAVGMPVVKGGSGGFARAFRSLIEAGGGVVRTGAEVERIVVRGGRAAAVRAGDEEIVATRAVIANVTPTQLYGRLLAGAPMAAEPAREAARFRYNRRSGMVVHVALSAPPRWRDERLAEVPIIHFSEGTDQVSLACAEAAAGLLPRTPTVVVGQPTVIDPSRVPEGAGLIWIQLQEVPRVPRGDAAEEIEVREGGWSEALVDAYVERVLDRVRPHVEDLDGLRLRTVALPPPELERRNPNLVGGDIYAGEAALDQSYLWRPLPGFGSHSTAVAGLYQCGASTYPGPGLNAASGRIVARAAIAAARGRGPAAAGRRLAARLRQ
ncbi:MAG: NAD(P)/FAD-dependent oxidoreductase [Actinobacteria bacterium]|nr:NAD(P)/FAD-dependent oxidoreductase [Actinomycetota bacterium]